MVPLNLRRWHQVLCFFLGIGIALGLGVITPLSASTPPWLQLLVQGGQYIGLSNTSTSQQVQIGQQIDQQLHQQYKFISDSQALAYVNRIGQTVARVSDCSEYPFRYSIVEDKQLNAFATTGGFVYVTTGLLNAISSDAELAGVLGHESGHICNNDLIRKMRQAAIEQGIVSLAGLGQNRFVKLGTQLAIDLPNSRQVEFRADVKGQTYLERAGYNRYGLVNFLRKLLKQPSPPTFLSNHPGTKERITALEQRIAANQ